jgi:LmbE family N-acetylglucosaminyl deacetylase
MKHVDESCVFVPDQSPSKLALEKTSHLAIGAHADDLEIFAFHAITECFESKSNSFTGVTITDGANSPRNGKFKTTTNEEMIKIRRNEQNQAARFGKYGAQIQLAHPSSFVKTTSSQLLVEQLVEIICLTKPKYIYTHNLADKHDTHVIVALKVIEAVRSISISLDGFYGCEVWRSLDWLNDSDKMVLPTSQFEELGLKLCTAHKSQIEGGKRYDLAAIARRRANATFFESTQTDQETQLTFAMNYLPLLEDKNISPAELVKTHIKSFEADVLQRIKKFSI